MWKERTDEKMKMQMQRQQHEQQVQKGGAGDSDAASASAAQAPTRAHDSTAAGKRSASKRQPGSHSAPGAHVGIGDEMFVSMTEVETTYAALHEERAMDEASMMDHHDEAMDEAHTHAQSHDQAPPQPQSRRGKAGAAATGSRPTASSSSNPQPASTQAGSPRRRAGMGGAAAGSSSSRSSSRPAAGMSTWAASQPAAPFSTSAAAAEGAHRSHKAGAGTSASTAAAGSAMGAVMGGGLGVSEQPTLKPEPGVSEGQTGKICLPSGECFEDSAAIDSELAALGEEALVADTAALQAGHVPPQAASAVRTTVTVHETTTTTSATLAGPFEAFEDAERVEAELRELPANLVGERDTEVLQQGLVPPSAFSQAAARQQAEQLLQQAQVGRTVSGPVRSSPLDSMAQARAVDPLGLTHAATAAMTETGLQASAGSGAQQPFVVSQSEQAASETVTCVRDSDPSCTAFADVESVERHAAAYGGAPEQREQHPHTSGRDATSGHEQRWVCASEATRRQNELDDRDTVEEVPLPAATSASSAEGVRSASASSGGHAERRSRSRNPFQSAVPSGTYDRSAWDGSEAAAAERRSRRSAPGIIDEEDLPERTSAAASGAASRQGPQGQQPGGRVGAAAGRQAGRRSTAEAYAEAGEEAERGATEASNDAARLAVAVSGIGGRDVGGGLMVNADAEAPHEAVIPSVGQTTTAAGPQAAPHAADSEEKGKRSKGKGKGKGKGKESASESATAGSALASSDVLPGLHEHAHQAHGSDLSKGGTASYQDAGVAQEVATEAHGFLRRPRTVAPETRFQVARPVTVAEDDDEAALAETHIEADRSRAGTALYQDAPLKPILQPIVNKKLAELEAGIAPQTEAGSGAQTGSGSSGRQGAQQQPTRQLHTQAAAGTQPTRRGGLGVGQPRQPGPSDDNHHAADDVQHGPLHLEDVEPEPAMRADGDDWNASHGHPADATAPLSSFGSRVRDAVRSNDVTDPDAEFPADSESLADWNDRLPSRIFTVSNSYADERAGAGGSGGGLGDGAVMETAWNARDAAHFEDANAERTGAGTTSGGAQTGAATEVGPWPSQADLTEATSATNPNVASGKRGHRVRGAGVGADSEDVASGVGAGAGGPFGPTRPVHQQALHDVDVKPENQPQPTSHGDLEPTCSAAAQQPTPTLAASARGPVSWLRSLLSSW